MKIGTRSLLYGVHAFWLHPVFVFVAWWQMFGFPWDPRLWLAFVIHDWGYWGKNNMDGEEGEQHPFWAANVMHFLFDWPRLRYHADMSIELDDAAFNFKAFVENRTWYDFTLYHSRFLAKRSGKPFSRLCVADKWAICITPAWIYVPMCMWSREHLEYMRDHPREVKHEGNDMIDKQAVYRWFAGVQEYVAKWVWTHKDGKLDLMTKLGVIR